MIEVIKQQFKENMSLNEKLNLTREFLQILCLKILSDKGYFDHLAFVGGTSLRILFDLRRFSEDLDFSIYNRKGFDLKKMDGDLGRSFKLTNLPFEPKIKSEGSVHYVLMKFTGLLKELELAAVSEQRLSIKLEIDMNPPEGWNLTDTVVNKIYLFRITHYDLPSLYAGKLHACFFRKFTKGRDLYDFVWYLGKKTSPNFTLLNSAIRQTEKKDPGIHEKNFKAFLLGGIKRIDFDAAKKDVERFLEDKKELDILNRKTIQNTVESVY